MRLVAGRYRLESEVGRGGMGVVWLAHDVRLDRPVALKQAHKPDARRGLRQMRDEAQTVGSLSHEHIVTLHDLVEDRDGHLWLVMEYVEGPSLAELLTTGPLDPRRAARVGAQVAEALAKAHRSDIVHCDVKPGNVLFVRLATGDAPDHVKLTDFGIARRDDDATLTDSGCRGTPAYMSPEVAAIQRATGASDVFSLGSTLYAAVFGEPPFGTEASSQVVMKRVGVCEVVVPPSAGPLKPVLETLLARDPVDRPTAARAAVLLRAAADGVSLPPDKPPAHRRRRQAAAGVGTVLLVVLAAVVLGPGTGPTPGPQAAPVAPDLLGEPRTADPCALTDPSALTGFGNAERATDVGGFNRCDVRVDLGPDAHVLVKVTLLGPSVPNVDELTGFEDVGVGHLWPGIPDGAGDGEKCVQMLRLLDGNQIKIEAQQTGEGDSKLCEMAEVAAGSAIDVLRKGQVQRRSSPLKSSSLAQLNSCTLLSAAVLARVFDLDPAAMQPGFANWTCDWGLPDGHHVTVRFDHDPIPNDAKDGEKISIAGREARVKKDDDNECTVSLDYQSVQNDHGKALYEVVAVEVSGGPAEQLCDPAEDLARALDLSP